VFVPIFGPNHVANLDGIPHSKVWGLRERDDSLVVHVLHAESVGYNLHHLETSRPLNIFSSEASHMRVIEDGDPGPARRRVQGARAAGAGTRDPRVRGG
jgi:hypothetical protein